jgi:hypothetical protein
MIYAIIKSTGQLIDRPRSQRINIPNENEVAFRWKNEDTEKTGQLTIAELYDACIVKSSYEKKSPDVEIHPGMFHAWFVKKFITGKSIENNLLGIEYFKE